MNEETTVDVEVKTLTDAELIDMIIQRKQIDQEAIDQINSKGYALPYQTEGRKVGADWRF